MKPLRAHLSFNTSGQSFRYYNVVWWCFQLFWGSLTLFIPLQSVSSVYYSVLQSIILLKHNIKWHNRWHFIIHSHDPPTRITIPSTHLMKKIFFLFFALFCFVCLFFFPGGGGGGCILDSCFNYLILTKLVHDTHHCTIFLSFLSSSGMREYQHYDGCHPTYKNCLPICHFNALRFL